MSGARSRRYDHPGEGDEGQRTPFQRDRDAILYSTAFRRLAGVTQVVAPGEGHVYHNRLTHTLEVAQIALRLAEYLASNYAEHAAGWGGLDPAVVEAAALAHDLGHPPFGHVAEKTLNKSLVRDGLIDGYEGNAQSFRILTRLAVRKVHPRGLNLTRATLNATLKYPQLQKQLGKKQAGKPARQANKKWGAYTSDRAHFDFAREGAGSGPCLEAQVMDWADDIAYSVHDMEDFYRAGLVPLDRVFGSERGAVKFVNVVFKRWAEEGIDQARGYGADQLAARRRAFVAMASDLPPILGRYRDQRSSRADLRQFTSLLIGRYVRNTALKPPGSPKGLDIPEEHLHQVEMLKELTWQYVIKGPALAGQQRGHRRIIERLYAAFAEATTSNKPDDWAILPERFREEMISLATAYKASAIPKAERLRLAADAIAGMTDLQAILMDHRLSGTTPGSAFDAIVG
jgi:dGTPase